MYHLVFGILYLLSLLPFRVLYLISDLACFLIFGVAGYRKKVVMENLAYAFPEKTEEERRQIAGRFYRNFVDNWIETIKLISVCQRSLNKRIS